VTGVSIELKKLEFEKTKAKINKLECMLG